MIMKETSVNKAKLLAKNFVIRADQLLAERGPKGAQLDWDRGTRRSGAVRRASMDLTRALADLRRGGK
jgi:hypothetical protein